MQGVQGVAHPARRGGELRGDGAPVGVGGAMAALLLPGPPLQTSPGKFQCIQAPFCPSEIWNARTKCLSFFLNRVAGGVCRVNNVPVLILTSAVTHS